MWPTSPRLRWERLRSGRACAACSRAAALHPLPNLFFSTCLSFIFPCYNHAWRMLIAIAILLTENRKYGFFIMKRSVHDNGVSYRLLLQTITTHQAYKHVASGSQRTYRCGVAQRLSVAAFCKKNDQRRRDPLWR